MTSILGSGYFWILPVLAVAVAAGYLIHRARAGDTELNIQRKSKILSPAEKGFFECLINALSDDFYIFAKVAALDVIEVSPLATKLETRSITRQLSGECFDYVMCKKHDMSIFGVIELENFEKRGSKQRGRNREERIGHICRAASLRLFYFDIRQDYQGVDIRRLITGRAGKGKDGESKGSQQSQLTIDNTSYAAYARQRSCPQCNGEVVTKVAVRGKHIGEKFLMCRKYPYCDYRLPMNDPKVVKMERRDNQRIEKPGFSDWSSG